MFLWSMCGLQIPAIVKLDPVQLIGRRERVVIDPGRTSHGKELCLLQHVLDVATPGDPASVCDVTEQFCGDVMASFNAWSKVAGSVKAAVLVAAVRGSPPAGSLLEIGTYCGYSTIKMATAAPGIHVTTLEADPVHMVVARNIIALAGISSRVNVWTGHSNSLLPRLGQNRCDQKQLKFSTVFMDRWGSQYHEDFSLLEQCGLLSDRAVVVADNVLTTCASLFLWHIASGDAYKTEIMSVHEIASSAEDWMSVSVRQQLANDNSTAWRDPPPQVLEVNRASDKLRNKVIGSGGSAASEDQARLMSQMRGLISGMDLVVASFVEHS